MRKLLAALGIGALCVALAGCTPVRVDAARTSARSSRRRTAFSSSAGRTRTRGSARLAGTWCDVVMYMDVEYLDGHTRHFRIHHINISNKRVLHIIGEGYPGECERHFIPLDVVRSWSFRTITCLPSATNVAGPRVHIV